jgi:hypothetical protein
MKKLIVFLKVMMVAVTISLCASCDAGYVAAIPDGGPDVVVGVAPWQDGVWIGGEWGWRGGRYERIGGHWEHARRGQTWHGGSWVPHRSGSGYHWNKGRWGK